MTFVCLGPALAWPGLGPLSPLQKQGCELFLDLVLTWHRSSEGSELSLLTTRDRPGRSWVAL